MVRCLEPLTPRVAIKQSDLELESLTPLSASLSLFVFSFSCFFGSLLPNLDLQSKTAAPPTERETKFLFFLCSQPEQTPHESWEIDPWCVCQVEIMFLLTSCCVSQGYPPLPFRRILEPLFLINSGIICRYSTCLLLSGIGG